MKTEAVGRAFSDQVRAIRLARGLTPSQAARKAGLSTAYWLRIESSPSVALQTRVKAIGRIAMALECSVRCDLPPDELLSSAPPRSQP